MISIPIYDFDAPNSLTFSPYQIKEDLYCRFLFRDPVSPGVIIIHLKGYQFGKAPYWIMALKSIVASKFNSVPILFQGFYFIFYFQLLIFAEENIVGLDTCVCQFCSEKFSIYCKNLKVPFFQLPPFTRFSNAGLKFPSYQVKIGFE